MLNSQGYNEKEVLLGIRPEHISEDAEVLAQFSESTVEANIEVSELTGTELMVYSALEGQQYVTRINSDSLIQPAQNIKLSFDLSRSHFFDKETESRIR
ncbi:TOBE domain-containing protein [Psychrobacillus vulpis]|uniref:TOBE domain-containing protein n=1 Tax=Psychrobacillus vulpis TaxID=2325572 RepID=A0A544TQA5_9BACI|nr:TOBE domain-containing protein [Psychrobacillus vulpis]TQR19647.1 TOBE domain-containing protein [Psychrobacillus vulpis]